MEGEGTLKVVHRNTSLLLQIKSTDWIVNLWLIELEVGSPTIGTQVVIAVGAIASHVHNLSTYGRVQVTNRFP